MKFLSGSLILTIGTLLGTVAFAQNPFDADEGENNLFPELRGVRAEGQDISSSEREENNPSAYVNGAVVQEGQDENVLFPELKTNKQLEQESEDAKMEKSGNLRLVIDNANITMPPMKNFSYCLFEMILENETPRKLQSLEVELGFGPSNLTVKFNGIGKGQKQKQDVTLAGDICQSILQVPKMDVKKCVLEGVTFEACKKRVEFVPISN